MTPLLPISDVEGARKVGDRLYFEYRCWESHQSSDAELWYHSHQQVEVLGMVRCDGYDIHSREERDYCGLPLVYRVRFDDWFVHDATEDELLDSKSEYERPDPPPPRNGPFVLIVQ